MPHTYSSLLTHVVFSTKDREPLLTRDMHEELARYLYVAADAMKVRVHETGGVGDHIHLLADVPSSVAPAEVIGKLKASTSKWIKQRWRVPFTWQRGYGAFSVSRSDVERVRAYIRDQEEHHRVRTFQEEFVAFLTAYEVEHDPEFLWR